MITAIAAVANGGYLVQPHVVDRMLDSDGNIVKTTDTSYKRQVISEDVSKRMTAILQKNATSESGKNGYVAGYRVAGKTGTSEKVALYYQDLAEGNDRGMQYVVSYGGYAPADDPQYALSFSTTSRRSAVRPAARRPARSSPPSWKRCSRTSA